MTGNVKWLKDKQDNIIIPNTLTTSVYNSNGKNIEELLDEEYQKQKVAIGENLGEWELVPTGLSIATTEIAYGNDVYVAIYNYGIYYSTDNATWTLANYPSVRGDNYGLTFGNGMFIVVGGYGKTMYSYDGINWSAGVAVNSYASLTRVQYCKDKFIATGYGGVDTVPSLYYSEDGINWTAANITTGLNYAKATYGNNMFVTIKSNGGAYYSEDGINWITATVPRYTMGSITFGNGRFVVIHSDGYISYSEDGINWTMIDKLTNSTIYHVDIAFANGIFVAMTDKYVFRSKDGINWYKTEYLNQTTISHLSRINYANNEFIICFFIGNNYVAKFLDNTILIEDALNELYTSQKDDTTSIDELYNKYNTNSEAISELIEIQENKVDKADYPITSSSGDKSKTITVNDCADAPIISTKIYGESDGIGDNGTIEIKTTNEDGTQSVTTNIPIATLLYDGDYIETDSEGKGYLHKATHTIVFDGSDDEEWGEGNNGQGFDIDTGDGTNDSTGGKDYGITYLRYFDEATMKYYYFDEMASEPNLICSHHFEYKDPKTNDGACIYADPVNSIIYLRVSDEINKASEIKTWLQSNPITVTYTLKDEVDTELPSDTLKEIRKLSTFNGITNVTCDGDMEFTYYKNNNGQVVGDLHDQVVRILNEGTGSTNIIEMTQAEYDALSEEEKMNDSIKLITDSDPSDISSILGNLASDYDNTATYNVNDYCLYGGLLYKCTTAITTGEEFDSSKWIKTDCGSEINELKSDVSTNSKKLDTIAEGANKVEIKHTVINMTTDNDGIVQIPHDEIEGVVINAYASSAWEWLTVRQGNNYLRFYEATAKEGIGARIPANTEISVIFVSIVIT